MQTIDIVRESKIEKTARTMQVASMCDVPFSGSICEKWSVNREDNYDWSIGLIVGPSGCGKSTILRELYGEPKENLWGNRKSVIDNFSANLSVKEIMGGLSKIGFNSPRCWLKPFGVLSNGQQFRVNCARSILEQDDVILIDEFSSVVDRQVAKIASASVGKLARSLGKRLVVASCHEDVVDWLNPDWVYRPEKNAWEHPRGCLQRPRLQIEIRKSSVNRWEDFKKYHYLSASANRSARWFSASLNGVTVGIIGWLHLFHRSYVGTNIKRCHRIVVHPDYQGIGVGMTLLNQTAALFERARIRTSNFGFIEGLRKSSRWVTNQKKACKASRDKPGRGAKTSSIDRLGVSFEFKK